MREIKFRGWADGRMLRDLIVTDHGWFIDFRDFENAIGFKTGLMQYTGMKDKNGVEIYEGDILTYAGMTLPIWIAWEHGIHAKWGQDVMVAAYAVYGEVVGNIHQNPELLTPTHPIQV
jgi:hypothetical protein